MCALVTLWDDEGQDIVMLAVILVIVIGTIRLVGSNANTVFSQAASAVRDTCTVDAGRIVGPEN